MFRNQLSPAPVRCRNVSRDCDGNNKDGSGDRNVPSIVPRRRRFARRKRMIDKAILFLRDTLNAHLSAPAPGLPESGEDAVVFLDGDKPDPVSFRPGAVTVLLIGMEQDPVMRAADPWQRVAADGTTFQSRPDIRLNLNVMFVARFKQYEQALAQLARILAFFHANPVLDARAFPGMPPDIPQLTMELLTLPLAEQNDLWNALRMTLQPSLLYRARMVVIADSLPAVVGPVTGEPQRELIHVGSTTV